MSAILDVFNPHISSVSRDLKGKTILIYGTNDTGKTRNATQFPKPFYLGFEKGINAISGVPFLPILKWADAKKITKQLTNSATLAKAQEKYQTIIFDGVEMSALMCQDYVCGQYGASSIGSGNEGYGLWKEYEQEYARLIYLLTNAGYTLYFISHESTRKVDVNGEEIEKIYPAGDKRSIDPICNLVDIIGWAKSNGLDQNGEEVKSSLYLKQSIKYHARSRFTHIVPMLKEFTAENLEKAIADAVEKEAQLGGNVVDFEEFAESQAVERLTFDQLREEIHKYAVWMDEHKMMDKYLSIVEEHLGVGSAASEATAKQSEALEMIVFDLEELDLDIE